MEYYTLLFMALLPVAQPGYVDPKYQTAVNTVRDISWDRSEPKKISDAIGQGISDNYPVATWIAGAGYSIGVAKQVRLHAANLPPVPGAKVMLKSDLAAGSNAIEISFPL